jgi:alcohol dehydrogenase class IV
MRQQWTFSTAGQIVFGSSTVHRLGSIIQRMQAQRVLVVTDQQLIAAGVLDSALQSLRQTDIPFHVFDGGEPEPRIQAAEACIDVASTVEPDVLLGLGGGSNIDVAKTTATVLKWGGVPADYFGEDRIPGPILPLVAVSTTAGTGSAVSPVAILTDVERNLKMGISSNYLRPRIALYDPMLTVSCPPQVTAQSGMDALTHAIEGYTCIDYRALPADPDQPVAYSGKFPLADALAERAIQLIGTNLRKAVYQGRNLAAREGMHLGALLAGMAFSNAGTAAVHALQYPIGTLTHTSHGLGNGLLLPYVMAYNLPAYPSAFARIGHLLGEQIEGLSMWQAADLGVEAVHRLKADIGVPRRLRDIGVTEDQLRAIARTACGIDRLIRNNPRPLSVEALEGILRRAL